MCPNYRGGTDGGAGGAASIAPPLLRAYIYIYRGIAPPLILNECGKGSSNAITFARSEDHHVT